MKAYCLPPPPRPPLVETKWTFFGGFKETKKSIEAQIRYEGAREEWQRVHDYVTSKENKETIVRTPE